MLSVDESRVYAPPSKLQVPDEDAPTAAANNSDSALSAPDDDDDDDDSDDNDSEASSSPTYAKEPPRGGPPVEREPGQPVSRATSCVQGSVEHLLEKLWFLKCDCCWEVRVTFFRLAGGRTLQILEPITKQRDTNIQQQRRDALPVRLRWRHPRRKRDAHIERRAAHASSPRSGAVNVSSFQCPRFLGPPRKAPRQLDAPQFLSCFARLVNLLLPHSDQRVRHYSV